jgi:hypothetical protein
MSYHVDRMNLAITLQFAQSYIEDQTSGFEEGIYDEELPKEQIEAFQNSRAEFDNISENDWDENFTFVKNHFESRNGAYDDCQFETYDEELDYIRNYPDKNKIWTVLDCDGEQYIAAGYHLVNQMGYLITNEPWITGTEQVHIEFDCDR